MLFQGLAVVGTVLAVAYLGLNFPRVSKDPNSLNVSYAEEP